MDIYVKKKYFNIKEESLSDNEIIVYIALRAMYRLNKEIYYVTINSILFELYGNCKYSRTIRNKILDGLLSLDRKKIIKVDQISNSEFILDLDGLYIDNGHDNDNKERDYFTVIRASEIHTIFNLKTKHDKIALLRYFVNVIGSINYLTYSPYLETVESIVNFVGFMPITFLAGISGINKSKAIEYNAIFEDAHLLFICRTNMYIISDNNIRNIHNHYGRYENAKYIAEYAKCFVKSKGYEIYHESKKTKEESDYRRSLKQKYNYMLSGKEYDYETVSEIFRYIHACNEEYKRIISECSDDEYTLNKYKSKIVDEEIFKKYGLPKRTYKDIWKELPDETPLFAEDMKKDKEYEIMTKAEYIELFGEPSFIDDDF